MKLIVLSHSLSSQTPLYGGKKSVRFKQDRSPRQGHSSNRFKLSFSTHAGTHVDAPYHFLEKGKKLLDFQPGQWRFARPKMLDVPLQPGETLLPKQIKSHPQDRVTDFLLIKTGFEMHRGKPAYWKKGPVIPVKTAKAIVKQFPKLQAIGFDLISLSSWLNREEGRRVHKIFLGQGVRIVEDMKLSGLRAHPDFILVSPLWAEGVDGGPVTVWAFYQPFKWENTDALFFDLDGVLLQSVQIKAAAFREMYLSYGKSIASKVVTHHLRHGGVSRFRKIRHYHREFLGIDLDEKQVNELAQKFAGLVFDKVMASAFIPGVKEMLEQARKRKKTCFVVTGAPETEAREILRRRKISGYFREIKGSPKAKPEIVRQLIRKHGLNSSRSVFFGDSITDLDAANANQVRFVGIGFDEGPYHVANFKQLFVSEKKNHAIS